MKKCLSLGAVCVLLALAGCGTGVDSPRGFSLPQGDMDKGKAAFINYKCLACHTLEGFEEEMNAIPSELETRVPLGGNAMQLTTYAELVTSIINPSHRISRGLRSSNQDEDGNSTMRNYNQEMTVQELIDIVAYLQPQYEIKPYTYTTYNSYYIH